MTESSLAGLLTRHTAALDRGAPYRPPTPAEIALVPALVAALAAGRHPDGAGVALGLTAREVDGVRVLCPDQPGGPPWVVLAARPRVVPAVLVEVPHPLSDRFTDVIGGDLLACLSGSILLQAGAHRVASAPPGSRDRHEYPADVAIRADALFSRVADGLVAAHGSVQVQVHGFADRPGVDAVVSPGAAEPGPLVAAVADRLAAAGLAVRGPHDPDVVDLAGRRNVQGRSAARHGTAFVHVELAASVRDDPVARDAAVVAVADAVAATTPGAAGPLP